MKRYDAERFLFTCTLWLLSFPWQKLRWKPYKEDTTLPIVPNIFGTTPTWQYNSTICWCRCVKPCVEPMNYRCATPLAMSLKSTRVTTWIWLLCSLLWAPWPLEACCISRHCKVLSKTVKIKSSSHFLFIAWTYCGHAHLSLFLFVNSRYYHYIVLWFLYVLPDSCSICVCSYVCVNHCHSPLTPPFGLMLPAVSRRSSSPHVSLQSHCSSPSLLYRVRTGASSHFCCQLSFLTQHTLLNMIMQQLHQRCQCTESVGKWTGRRAAHSGSALRSC